MSWQQTEQARKRLAAEKNSVALGVGDRLRICLCYPNTYAVGMSNLGFQTLYHLFNSIPGVRCERAFLPDEEDSSTPLVSLESETPLGNFDVLAFSLSFDLDALSVPRMLLLSGVPIFSSEREAAPLVIAGGILPTFNPEPLADIVDAFLIGEAEGAVKDLVEGLVPCATNQGNITERLAPLAQLPGVYVPSRYQVSYHDDGSIAAVDPQDGAPDKVERLYLPDLDSSPCRSRILTRETEFGGLYLVEISRGCPRRCKFCISGHLYQPVRYRSLQSILVQAKEGLEFRPTIGLIGAAVSDHPEIEAIAAGIADMGGRVSFASVRADRLSASLLDATIASGTQTLTLAPEAGSQRLRRHIGKGLEEEEILSAVQLAQAADLRRLRLYFMLGLPGETETDIDAIAHLVRQTTGSKMTHTTLSVCAFVPKPQTAFEREAMASRKTLRERIAQLKRALGGIKGVEISAESPNASFLQAVISRGDRRLGKVLAHLAQSPAPRFADWNKAIKAADLAGEWFASRPRKEEEILPWDHLGGECRAGRQ